MGTAGFDVAAMSDAGGADAFACVCSDASVFAFSDENLMPEKRDIVPSRQRVRVFVACNWILCKGQKVEEVNKWISIVTASGQGECDWPIN